MTRKRFITAAFLFLAVFAFICWVKYSSYKPVFYMLHDVLAVLAAIVWAGYSVPSRKISRYGINTIQTTRRVFAYGILFMLPVLFRFEAGVQR